MHELLYHVFDRFGEIPEIEISHRPLWYKFVTKAAFGVHFFILCAQIGREVLTVAVVADEKLATVIVSKLQGPSSHFIVKCQSGMCEARGYSVK